MMIIHHNGRETETYADHFPFADMPRGSWVTVTLTTGGKWTCIVELARPDYVLTAGGGRFDIGDVDSIELGKP